MQTPSDDLELISDCSKVTQGLETAKTEIDKILNAIIVRNHKMITLKDSEIRNTVKEKNLFSQKLDKLDIELKKAEIKEITSNKDIESLRKEIAEKTNEMKNLMISKSVLETEILNANNDISENKKQIMYISEKNQISEYTLIDYENLILKCSEEYNILFEKFISMIKIYINQLDSYENSIKTYERIIEFACYELDSSNSSILFLDNELFYSKQQSLQTIKEHKLVIYNLNSNLKYMKNCAKSYQESMINNEKLLLSNNRLMENELENLTYTLEYQYREIDCLHFLYYELLLDCQFANQQKESEIYRLSFKITVLTNELSTARDDNFNANNQLRYNEQEKLRSIEDIKTLQQELETKENKLKEAFTLVDKLLNLLQQCDIVSGECRSVHEEEIPVKVKSLYDQFLSNNTLIGGKDQEIQNLRIQIDDDRMSREDEVQALQNGLEEMIKEKQVMTKTLENHNDILIQCNNILPCDISVSLESLPERIQQLQTQFDQLMLDQSLESKSQINSLNDQHRGQALTIEELSNSLKIAKLSLLEKETESEELQGLRSQSERKVKEGEEIILQLKRDLQESQDRDNVATNNIKKLQTTLDNVKSTAKKDKQSVLDELHQQTTLTHQLQRQVAEMLLQTQAKEEQLYLLTERAETAEESLNNITQEAVIKRKTHKSDLKNKDKLISGLQSQIVVATQNYSDLVTSSTERESTDDFKIKQLSDQVSEATQLNNKLTNQIVEVKRLNDQLSHQITETMQKNQQLQIDINDIEKSRNQLLILNSKQTNELEAIRSTALTIKSSVPVVTNIISTPVTPFNKNSLTTSLLRTDPTAPCVVRIFYSAKKMTEDQTVQQGETAIFCGRDKYNKKYVRIFTREYGTNLMRGDFFNCQSNDCEAGENKSLVSSVLFGVVPIDTYTVSDKQLLEEIVNCNSSDSDESNVETEEKVGQKRRLE